MKKYILFSVLSVLINIIFAQTAPPNGMIYQAVARDGSGNLAAKRTIYVQTTVLKGSATGTVMYSDEHKVSSNADAMFSVIVGQGTYLSGTYKKLTDIPWDKDKYFFNLKICVAPTIPRWGWTPSYTDMGTTQFWSVPYAMFSGKSGDSLTLTVNGTGRQIKLGNYKPIFFSVADKDSVATNELQTLSRNGGRLLLSLNGGLVTLPDSSATNELQSITRSGGRIILNQNGGTIFLPDSSATNELQTISKTGSTITLSQGGGSFTDDDKQTLSTTGTGSTKTLSISNGNSVQINVNDADSSTTNELQTLSRTGGRIQLSQNGGIVTLPDSSATNELQTVSISAGKGRITLSNGGGNVVLNDSSGTNELQTISRTGGRILLNLNGGTVTLPDSSASNELQTISQTGNIITLSQSGGSVTITDNDKQQLGITTSKGTISLSNGGSVQLADSSAMNELQTVSISSGKGRITLSNGGGNVVLNDSSATNELQTMSRTGGRISLNQNGGTVTLPDSSASNELQTISQTGNTITLSQSGGSVTITDNDKQQLGITTSKGTISLSNGGSVQLADSSATNELQTVSISSGKGRITLSNGGGNVVLNDSSGTNELQTISRTGGRILLNQNGGTVTLPDSSSTNELQTLSISNDTLSISNGNKIKLPSSSSGGSSNQGVRLGFSTNTTWTCPAGVTSITVELWAGAGGGGGAGSAMLCVGGCVGKGGWYSVTWQTNPVWLTAGGNGGNGGAGGYNRKILKVNPGTTYNIIIGNGGVGGNGGNSINYNGSIGGDGGNTLFDTSLTAIGGRGGGPGLSWNCDNANGSNGSNGNVLNYSTLNFAAIQGSSAPRSFLPTGYVSDFIIPSCCSTAGRGGIGPKVLSGNQTCSVTSGENGVSGEKGYCVIHY